MIIYAVSFAKSIIMHYYYYRKYNHIIFIYNM